MILCLFAYSSYAPWICRKYLNSSLYILRNRQFGLWLCTAGRQMPDSISPASILSAFHMYCSLTFW
jgi:hypothetical protein